MQRDSAWMMAISTRQLLHSFRTTSGVYDGLEGGYDSLRKLGGWESLDCELRGHTTGHLLSAYALMYASTGENCFKEKGDSLVAGLAEVQNAFGNGYLSAFPEELINRNIRGERVWAPWYTLHKIVAGLIDQYRFAGSELALEEAIGMAAWAYEKLSPLNEETRRKMLRNEFGGIGESWWNLFEITSDIRCRFLAEFFFQDEVILPLREGKADFGVKHTNTYIPKVIAEARNYEINGNPESRAAAEFFWKEMISRHIFATGSLSDKEHFFNPEDICEHITGQTGETCCTYNMLKLSRHIFCWNPSPSVADYYERALYNHILGGQNPSDGMYTYFLPLKTGTHKVYSTAFDSFWCCVGSSFESNAKFGDSIYFHGDDTLYVNLFIPSELSSEKFGVRMETMFPESGNVRLTVTVPGEWTLAVRQPCWSEKTVIRVNGRRLKIAGDGYVCLERKWKKGDVVEVEYDMGYTVEPSSGDPSVGVVTYGPLVLARPLGTGGFAAPQPVSDPSKHNDYYTYDYHIPDGTPEFSVLPSDFSGLVPLYRIHNERYEVYWRLPREGKLNSFRPGEIWPDDRGVHINAHGGGMLLYAGRYYWFGEHKTEGKAGNKAHVGVHCYSSEDLYNWKDEGIALKVSGDPESPIADGCILERPKVIHNQKTGKFVMWFHLEPKGRGYGGAMTGVAEADKVTGPYVFARAVRPLAGVWPVNVLPIHKECPPDADWTDRANLAPGEHPDSVNTLGRDFPHGQHSRDMTLFADDDGKAYHISSSESNSVIHIAELTDDYLDFSGRYVRAFIGDRMEAPAVFKKDGLYYFMGSECTGWRPNPAHSAVAPSIWGPWTQLGNPCVDEGSGTTYRSQSTFIIPVAGRKDAFIYMGDRWTPDNAIDGRYVWLPVEFTDDGRFILRWRDGWDLSVFD